MTPSASLFVLSPHPPHPCFGQMGKLREEKECSMSQVQELETSLAKLRTKIGKPGLVLGLVRAAENGG